VLVKLQTIIDAQPAVSQFAQKDNSARAAYWAARWVKKLQSEARHVQEARTKMIEKYGAKVKRKVNGTEQEFTEVKPENIEAYTVEMKALLDEEVELEGLHPIKFKDIEKLNISPAILADLDFMIEAPVET
jgi:hypothetical protein